MLQRHEQQQQTFLVSRMFLDSGCSLVGNKTPLVRFFTNTLAAMKYSLICIAGVHNLMKPNR